ncbi:MAG: dienelactone hydrolase family protein [Gemmataceae bacterium]|nr:dienelactone hydrolase family protein [Gemmataceae bacterium]
MSESYPAFVRAQGAALRKGDADPADLPAWMKRRAALIASVKAAMGSVPAKPCDLEPRTVGVLERKGYRIEKVVLRTRPEVWMPGNLFLPEAKGKRPAVLCVHGHWAGARRDPVVQARCLGLVKLGFAVLAVDAFGAGERHPVIKSGSYHGALMGASLWPAGLTLLGVQAYDNRRAVDWLLSRPEVGDRVGITGASGGGNQTMYAAATDPRLQAAVPVCSVGTYQAYLRAACCVCEVLPGALRFTEEGDILGLVAPRALMVVSATKDAHQFSVGEARKSLARARAVYKLHGKEDRLAHAVFDSGHDYSKPMREAMYGWMAKHLAGEGDGKPIPEPAFDLEKPEDLACFPEGERPKGFLFPESLAAREGAALLARFADRKLDHKEAWEAVALSMRDALPKVLGPMPESVKQDGYPLAVEEGVRLPGSSTKGGKRPVLLLHLDGKDAAMKHPLAERLKGWDVHSFDLRGTGSLKPKGDAVAGAPDHNSAEHGLWIGRPLLGQWLADVRAWLEWKGGPVVGLGAAGIVALLCDAPAIAAVDVPESFLAGKVPMGLRAPGIMAVGDVPHLAALRAPRLTFIGGDAKPWAFARRMFGLMKAGESLAFGDDAAKWLGEPGA